MTGPDASAFDSMVMVSSGDICRVTFGSSLAAEAEAEALAAAFSGSLADLPQATRVEAMARARRVLRNIKFSRKWHLGVLLE
jgi:hypothetical protein